MDPLPRRARKRGAARGARGHLQRAARRGRGDALSVGVEGERAARGAPGGDRGRPHPPPAVAPHPQPRERPDPRPVPRAGIRHLRDPGSRPEGRGARRRRAHGERQAARLLLQRHLRVRLRLRLLGLTRAIRTERALVAVLLGLAALSWWWTIERMRGMDNGPWTSLGTLSWFLGLWIVMMAAMMLPSAIPAVALYVGLARGRPAVAALFFTSGYLAGWGAAGPVAWRGPRAGGRLAARGAVAALAR